MIGFKRPFPTALIIPRFPILKSWCRENNVHWTAPQYMVINPKVVQLFEEELERLNQELQNHERLRTFHLLHEEWSEEKGELTNTLKLKRPVILEKFAKEINKMYEE